MLQAFKKTSFEDPNISRFQQNVEAAINQLLSVPFLNGNKIASIELKVGANQIPHLLTRKYQGYFLLRKNAAGDVYEGESTDSSKFINLTSTAVMTVDVWVF